MFPGEPGVPRPGVAAEFGCAAEPGWLLAGPWGGASGEGATCAAAFMTATQSKTAHNQDTRRYEQRDAQGRRHKFMEVRRKNMANDTSERKQDQALQRRQHVW